MMIIIIITTILFDRGSLARQAYAEDLCRVLGQSETYKEHHSNHITTHMLSIITKHNKHNDLINKTIFVLPVAFTPKKENKQQYH